MTQQQGSNNWCFTVNNYTDEDVINVKALDYNYLVYGYEVGTQGTPHLQCYVELTKRSRRTALVKAVPRAGNVNPRYAASTAENASNYCKKGEQSHEEWLRDKTEGPNFGLNANFFEDGVLSTERMLAGKSHSQSKTTKNKDALTIMSAPNKTEALRLTKELMPYDYLLHSTAIEISLQKIFKAPYEHRFTQEDFECPPLSLEDKKIPQLFWGPSGVGKTQYALAQFKRPFLVRHIDKLKELTPDYDGIVFDDLSFTHWPISNVIHLLDIEEESDVHCRNTCGTIPRDMARIFTHNTENPFYSEERLPEEKATNALGFIPLRKGVINEEQKKAIERRIIKTHFNKSVFAKVVSVDDSSSNESEHCDES